MTLRRCSNNPKHIIDTSIEQKCPICGSLPSRIFEAYDLRELRKATEDDPGFQASG